MPIAADGGGCPRTQYTHAAILKGKYPFSLPADRAVYLTSVRDMGRLAGACLAEDPPPAVATTGGRTLNVASELTSPAGMAAAFAAAQGTPCVHKQARTLRWIARLFLPDLFEVIQFYRTSCAPRRAPPARPESGVARPITRDQQTRACTILADRACARLTRANVLPKLAWQPRRPTSRRSRPSSPGC